MITQPLHFEIVELERDFGIDTQQFIDFMRPTFTLLHLDPYDAKRDKVAYLKRMFPTQASRLDTFLSYFYAGEKDLFEVRDLIAELDPVQIREFDRIGMTGRRKRSIAGFTLVERSFKDLDWYVERHPVDKFVQDVPDSARQLVRTFHEAPKEVAECESMGLLMLGLADKVRSLEPMAKVLHVNLHQVQIYADVLSLGDNSPEGIHRDGADYIVSALVLERAGIVGGETIIYAEDKQTELFRCTLQAGQGMFQEDRVLWHYVTPVQEDPAVDPQYGHRSILGFDFTIMG